MPDIHGNFIKQVIVPTSTHPKAATWPPARAAASCPARASHTDTGQCPICDHNPTTGATT